MMKYFLLIIPIVALLSSCSSQPGKAVEYSNDLIGNQIIVVEALDGYQAAFELGSGPDLQQKFDRAVLVIDSVMTVVESKEPFDGSDELKKHLIELLDTYKSVCNTEFNQVTDLFLLPDSLYTSAADSLMKALWESGNLKLTAAFERFNAKHKDFAMKYKIDIAADTLKTE